MSDFRYSDIDDQLTSQLISEEYDEQYWAESEDLVLDHMEEFLIERLGRTRIAFGRFLDAGCGTGRLIPRFAGLFSKVAAFDPDETRAREAARVAAKLPAADTQVFATDSAGFRRHIEASKADANGGAGRSDKAGRSGEFDELDEEGETGGDSGWNLPFDAILSSHVVQHIPHVMAVAMLKDLRSLIADDGVLLLTTTFIDGEESSYAVEAPDENGHRVEYQAYERDFNEAMGIMGVLPVCRFAVPHITRLLAEAGFDVVETGCFHFSNEDDAASDVDNTADPARRKDARDAYYLCVPRVSEAEASAASMASAGKAAATRASASAASAAKAPAAKASTSRTAGAKSPASKASAARASAAKSPVAKAAAAKTSAPPDASAALKVLKGDDNDELMASGKVCFMQYYALDHRAINKLTLHRAEVLTANGGLAAEILHEFDVVEGFLYGGGLHFPAKRFAFTGRELQHRDIPFQSSYGVVTLYPEMGICQLSVCFTFDKTPVDDLVYLHQTQGNPGAEFTMTATPEVVQLRQQRSAKDEWVGTLPDECTISIPALCNQVLKDLKLEPISSSSAFLMEINEFGDADVPDDLTFQQKRALYGLLTGDEGWRFVPDDLVQQRYDNSWSTRQFVKAVVFSNNCVLLNFNQGACAQNYLAGQYDSGEEYYGSVNEYFVQDAHTAGVNHGIFFSMETGMLVKAIANRLLAERPQNVSGKFRFLSGEMNRSKRYRGELISTLSRIESLGIAEMGELDTLVTQSLSVTERVSNIRELLELVESELSLSYETNTNKMVGLLTVLGLLFAIIQIIMAIPGIGG